MVKISKLPSDFTVPKIRYQTVSFDGRYTAYHRKSASALLTDWHAGGFAIVFDLLSPALLPAFVMGILSPVSNLLRGEGGEAQTYVLASL